MHADTSCFLCCMHTYSAYTRISLPLTKHWLIRYWEWAVSWFHRGSPLMMNAAPWLGGNYMEEAHFASVILLSQHQPNCGSTDQCSSRAPQFQHYRFSMARLTYSQIKMWCTGTNRDTFTIGFTLTESVTINSLKATWSATARANLSILEPASAIFLAALITSEEFFRGPLPLGRFKELEVS